MGLILLKSQLSHFLLFSVLSSFLLVSCFSSSPVKCRSEEKTALLQFRSHFSCDARSHNCSGSKALTWKKDVEDCCEWDGVSCDGDTGYVVSLNLPADYLYGKIPLNSSLFNLIHLEYLRLSGNDFSNSQISPLFGNFRNLTVLDLGDSGFSGVVPNEFFQLPNLKKLDLSGNKKLSGKLPDSIGELASLQILSLGWCNFSGSVPESIGNLTQLYSLNITNNHFTGEVHNLSEFSSLDLSENHFTGTIDLDLFIKFQKLKYLHLSSSGLSVTTNNSNYLSAFPSIESVSLSSCDLSTNILTNLSAQSQLEYIALSNNKIGNELNPSICNLNSLYYLDLSHNQFNGLIPACLGSSNGSLSMLNLQSNKFDGIIPRSFGHSKSIQLLDLSKNVLQGSLPRSLENCTQLEVLNLGGNMLTDEFPFWLGNLSSLRVLILRENKLYGTMSKSARNKQGQFQNMHIIDMSNNDLTGTFPAMFFDSWNSMTIVEEDKSPYAFVQAVQRGGYFYQTGSSHMTRCLDYRPPRYYYYYYSLNIMNKGLLLPYQKVLTTMKVVDFSSNKFYGSIPPSVGRLKGIQVLNLSGNSLTGQIPWFLGNLTKLESLDLSNNTFSGEIPLDLSNLNFLEVIDLSQNNLSGAIPGFLDKFPNASYEGNQGLCGLPLSKLCKPNSPPKPLPSKKKTHFEFNLNRFGWEVVVVGYGGGILFGLVIGYFIPVRNNPWFAQTFNFKVQQNGRARNLRSG